jgi:hypothetical protein
MTKRDDFSPQVKDALAKRANQTCSNPNCPRITSGPSSSSDKAVNMGVAAHICAAAPGGKRYNREMTPGERSSIQNGIWLCPYCADLIDKDPEHFTVELLHHWKKEHENKIRKKLLLTSKDDLDLPNQSLKLPSSTHTYCIYCGIIIGKQTDCIYVDGHKYQSFNDPVYCTNCGVQAGKQSECIFVDGHVFKSYTNDNVYCIYCGIKIGKQTDCTYVDGHKYQSFNGPVYCTNCGVQAGKQSECIFVDGHVFKSYTK